MQEFERLRDEIDQNEEEDGVGEEHADDPGDERAVLGSIEPEARGTVGHQHPEPEQQRSRLPPPQGREAVVKRHAARRMGGNVKELVLWR